MNDEDHRSAHGQEYQVGYAKPPIETRFQRGRSGNPHGRPKGSKNFSTFLEMELAQQVTLIENGKRKKMPKRQALAKQLVNRALSNDPRTTALVLEQIRRSEESTRPPNSDAINRPQDALLTRNIIRRIRMNEGLAVDPDNEPPEEDHEPRR